jgi:D-arabinose 1-dehydrogenase-like Zn-dependent alcohol dehydrogenase
MCAKAMGYRVMNVDIDDNKLKIAQEGGVDIVVNTLAQEWLFLVKQATDGQDVRSAAVFTPAQAGYNTASEDD